jgi:hypothetical protein
MNTRYDFSEYIKNQIPNIPELVLEEFIMRTLKPKTDVFIRDFKEKERSVHNVCMELSNYSDVLANLLEFKKETIDRYASIVWNKDLHPCSRRSIYDIKKDLKMAASNGNEDEFIGYLNELLGNCCISSMNELDD